MPTQTTFYLNLYDNLAVNTEPLVFEFTDTATLHTVCQQIRDAWTSGTTVYIQNPAGSEYVSSARIARFSVA